MRIKNTSVLYTHYNYIPNLAIQLDFLWLLYYFQFIVLDSPPLPQASTLGF